MEITKEIAIDRVEHLIFDTDRCFHGQEIEFQLIDETTFGSIAFISRIYNEDHEFVKQIKTAREAFLRGNRGRFFAQSLIWTIKGILETIKFEIKNDMLGSIESLAKGEILGDFISLSKSLLSERYKDSAAVLACGALEDSLKKFAARNDLNVEDKELSSVISSLKAKGLVKGAQSGVIQSYVQLRNKAFHAQFDKIDSPEVASLISFVEQFLIANFV
ncbi:MAG: hypothetical protein ACHQF0_06075 [Chitinophagales bacterium]